MLVYLLMRKDVRTWIPLSRVDSMPLSLSKAVTAGVAASVAGHKAAGYDVSVS